MKRGAASRASSRKDNLQAAWILARLLTDAEFREQQRVHCAGRAKVFSREAYLKRQDELLEKILQMS